MSRIAVLAASVLAWLPLSGCATTSTHDCDCCAPRAVAARLLTQGDLTDDR